MFFVLEYHTAKVLRMYLLLSNLQYLTDAPIQRGLKREQLLWVRLAQGHVAVVGSNL